MLTFAVAQPASVLAQAGGPTGEAPNFAPGFVPQGSDGRPNFNSAQDTGGDADFAKRLAAIDSTVMQKMAEQNIPAYCLTIIRNGKTVFHKPYGMASFNPRQACTNETVFGLASLTKTFTALTLLSLVDKGLVNLDDPLSKYIGNLTRPYQPLTIRQLASMCAGVPSQVSQEVAWRDQLEILDHTPLVSEPGSQFLYSNFSYRLIGSVIESVTHRPYFEVVRETILMPFQMNDTATTVMLQGTGRVAQAYGDNQGNGPVRPIEYKNPAISFAAGMLATTSNDLEKYVYGLLNRKILSQKAYKTLWYERPPLTTGQPSPWAFGWHAGNNQSMNNQYVVNMNGGTPGVASTIIILPEANCAVIALCNLRKPPVYAIARTVAAMAFGNGDSGAVGGAGGAADEPSPGAGQD